MQSKRKVSSPARQNESRVRAERVFLSSTFRDFGEERDLLVRQVFPDLMEAMEISENLYAQDSMEITPQLSAVGQLRFLQKRYKEPYVLMSHCLAIRRANLPVGDTQITNVEARLAEVKEAMSAK